MEDWVDLGVPTKANSTIRQKKCQRSSDVSIRFYATLEKAALQRLDASKSPVFHVDVLGEPIYTVFLNHLAPDLKQQYTCTACNRFANRYADLALVNEQGYLEPLLWNVKDLKNGSDMYNVFAPAVKAVETLFIDKKVSMEFKITANTKTRGVTGDGPFHHMRLRFPESRVRKPEFAGHTSANTQELATMLKTVIDDYSLTTIRKAYRMLVEHKLPYADNHKASAKWLLDLVERGTMEKANGSAGYHNLLYRHAALAFVGSLKQLRSGALGSLLADVENNCSWDEILQKWQKICDPPRYVRPQAPPALGNIQAAEKLFEEMGLTKNDLRRRLMVQDDVPKEVIMWASEIMKPGKMASLRKGIFDDVKPKEQQSASPKKTSSSPATTITFTRFVTHVLPRTKKLDCWLGHNDNIFTFITGLPGSKPLMQWHDDEGKNLASSYGWSYPPPVESHSLKSNAWNEVRCLVPFPPLWDGVPLTTKFPLLDPDGEESHKYKYYHKQKGFRYLFVLDQNHEKNLRVLPLFPTYFKSDLHGVRSTIEAYSKLHNMEDVEDGMKRGGFVGGVSVSRSETMISGLKFRTTTVDNEVDEYRVILFE